MQLQSLEPKFGIIGKACKEQQIRRLILHSNRRFDTT
jgi:hypothetical protein